LLTSRKMHTHPHSAKHLQPHPPAVVALALAALAAPESALASTPSHSGHVLVLSVDGLHADGPGIAVLRVSQGLHRRRPR
jgi:hypothetical protein